MTLEQIGQKLQAARESKGLSLRQVQDRTKIPMNHLQSLESGHAEDLPEPVYVGGFIKLYADSLGLNGPGLADEYRQGMDELIAPGRRVGSNQANFSSPEYLEHIKVNREPPTFKTLYFNALLIIFVIGLISYLSMSQFNNQNNQSDPGLLSLRQSVSSLSPTTVNNGANTLPSSVTTTPPATPLTQISLKANQHVWVEVKSMGQAGNLYTGYMEPGDSKDFQDSQGLMVRVGDGGSLSVDYQGKIEPFGEAGKVSERSFLEQPIATNQAVLGSQSQGTTSETVTANVATLSSTNAKRRSKKTNARLDNQNNHLPQFPTHRYIPGESIGDGSGKIDVPYRYGDSSSEN